MGSVLNTNRSDEASAQAVLDSSFLQIVMEIRAEKRVPCGLEHHVLASFFLCPRLGRICAIYHRCLLGIQILELFHPLAIRFVARVVESSNMDDLHVFIFTFSAS